MGVEQLKIKSMVEMKLKMEEEQVSAGHAGFHSVSNGDSLKGFKQKEVTHRK